MSLTQQFLIVSIFPLSFLGMLVYLWRSGLKREQLRNHWSIMLLATAVWASSVLRYYGGLNFPVWVAYNWGIVGTYAFSIAAMATLLTTLSYLATSRRHGRVALALSWILLITAVMLDPQIWPYQVDELMVAGQAIRYFDIWAAVWITSWLLPVVAAWMLTQQADPNFPNSLFRNQIRYWLLVLTLFFVGGSLASVRQPGQPFWLEMGMVVVILAALVGTVSIAHNQLPDLQMASRRLLIRLSGTLVIFGLTWVGLWFIVRWVTRLPTNTDPTLILLVAAAVFAGVFTLLFRLVNVVTGHLSRERAQQAAALADFHDAAGYLPEPAQVGELFLRLVQSTLMTDECWLFTVADGPAGGIVLRPLTGLEDQPLEAAIFAGNSPFTHYMREQRTPLVQYDVDTLSGFDVMPAAEKKRLAAWQRVLYMPLHAGRNLVGVLSLGTKYTGESYRRGDFDWLRASAHQVGPLLAQAQHLASLRQVNDYVFAQNQALIQEKQHLAELTNLYTRFNRLIAPDLKRPFRNVPDQLHQLQSYLNGKVTAQQILNDLEEQSVQLQSMFNHLITIATHVQTRGQFQFRPIHLEQVAQTAVRRLQTMAEARRVHIEFEPDVKLPAITGDEKQLEEAVHHLLHNAIKFNKIGGSVQLNLGADGAYLYLHVRDTGVGMPKERLERIWHGFPDPLAVENGRSAGIGLPLTQFIIAAHGGYVEAESKYGSGSVFSVYLPLAFQEEEA